MSHGCIACFKHLKRNCKCGSPKQVSLGYKARVPVAGNVNDWKEFVLDYIYPIYASRHKVWTDELIDKLKGTRLESVIKKFEVNPNIK